MAAAPPPAEVASVTTPAQPASVPRQPPQPQRTTPAQSSLSIPFLTGANSLSFGRTDSDYHTVDLVINIDAQETLPGLVYDQIIQLTSIDLPLTRGMFIQMWKTILLKRVQDVIEKQRLARPNHFIRLGRNLELPAPLADLVYSIGRFHSHATGVVYDIAQPPRADPAPAYWDVDPLIVTFWQQSMARMRQAYTMREYPSPSEFDNRPLGLTTIQTANQLRSVRAYTNETSANDALIRFVNDDLYVEHNHFTFDTSHLSVVDRLELASTRARYISCYTTGITF